MAEPVAFVTDTVKLIRPQAQITPAPTAVAAFVGRALKGPVNQATPIDSFEAYQRLFGGLWLPSTMSYAVEQFFENGGRECLVVRVTNGARPPTVTMRAGAGRLRLTARAPGTREYLRAAVDYDGIDDSDDRCFNLVLQRIRAPGSEHVEEQEIYRRVSLTAGFERWLPDVLADSQLVRLAGPLPRQRPDRTQAAPPATAVGYVASRPDGDDGEPLTDYDLIGDAQAGTGLFALRAAGPFNMLYLAPLSRQQDVGLPALLVALRLCRERQSLLLVDPPQSWDSAEAALEALRSWPFYSEDACMVFPRVLALDRLRGRYERFGSGAALAGTLARAGASASIWSAPAALAPAVRPSVRPAVSLTDLDRLRLMQSGVNVWQTGHERDGAPVAACTLLPELGTRSSWRGLGARRLALFVMSSIEHGTRWTLFEHNGPPLWERVRAQVSEFLGQLDEQGAFGSQAGDGEGQRAYFVICDERLNAASSAADGVQLLFGFTVQRPGDYHVCLVTHRPGASSVRPVSLNRYALPLTAGPDGTG